MNLPIRPSCWGVKVEPGAPESGLKSCTELPDLTDVLSLNTVPEYIKPCLWYPRKVGLTPKNYNQRIIIQNNYAKFYKGVIITKIKLYS